MVRGWVGDRVRRRVGDRASWYGDGDRVEVRVRDKDRRGIGIGKGWG